MDFVIVTGLSGAGKTGALHAMEDIGFFCVDNLPAKLIPIFYDLCLSSREERQRVAVVTDTRGGEMFASLFDVLDGMKASGRNYRILFLDAGDGVLMNRYQENRRRHPLAQVYHGSLEQAVRLEREMLLPVRERADYIIDTSLLTTAQMKARISGLFLEDSGDAMMLQCVSFGFKYGIPAEADLVFDVRCLPNPFYIQELKHQTGLDAPVREYVMKWEQTQGFIRRWIDLIDYMVPLYCAEGKSQLVIAVGCIGVHHRSVALAQHLCDHFLVQGKRASVTHRDIKKG